MAGPSTGAKRLYVCLITAIITQLTFHRRRIFFDGYLPHAKRDTRRGRLAGYTKQLNEYFQAYPTTIPFSKSSSSLDITPKTFLRNETVPAGHANLPAPPFLVPAVIEALYASGRYTSITEVVPGEADLFCAQFLHSHSGVVLTGDSDLLVHDVGAEGKVGFFRDIEIKEEGTMSCLLFHPATIASRLKIPSSHGVLGLAFEMFMNTHGTFRQLHQQAMELKSYNAHKTMYLSFVTEYLPLQSNPRQSEGLVAMGKTSPLRRCLEQLDPRISEYVLQFPSFAGPAGFVQPSCLYQEDSVIVSERGAEVFLPFLLDCPIHLSGWEVSTSIRQLAFGILQFVLPESERSATVIEYRRQKTGREWQLPTEAEVIPACESLLMTITQCRTNLPHLPVSDTWRALSYHQDVEWAFESGRPALSGKCIRTLQIQEKRGNGALSWDVIHFVAQLHGSYYSLRILQQILGVVLTSNFVSPVPDCLTRLQEELKSLPPLADLPRLEEEVAMLGRTETKEMVITIRKMLNAGEDVLDVMAEVGKRKSQAQLKKESKNEKRKKRLESKVTMKDMSGKSSNPFDLLSDG